MKSLVAKEIRLLLPTFVVALLLAMLPLSLMHGPFYSNPFDWTLGPFYFGTVVLALSTFGREFTLKTFPLLLAQPSERRRIWRTKTLLLAGAMAVVYAAWLLSCVSRSPIIGANSLKPEPFGDDAVFAAGMVLVSFVGGLWTTLLFRQFTAALLFTMFVPAAIPLLMMREGTWTLMGGLALGAYVIAGLWFARRQFLQAQDAAWTGGNVTLAGWRTEPASSTVAPGIRRHQAIRALVWKEIRLHDITLVGVAGLFLLHLAVVLVRKSWHVEEYPSGMVYFVLNVFGVLWLLVPLIAGSACVAEERRIGTLDGQLCLPVSSRAQCFIKLAVVLILGGLLSPLLLFTAEGIGSAIGAATTLSPEKFAQQEPGSAFALFVVAFPALSLVSFYASSLTRNVIQALAAAVVAAIGVFLFYQVVSNSHGGSGAGLRVHDWFIWWGNLIHYIAWPTLTLVFLWLAYRNFRFGALHVWRRNCLGLLGGLAFIFVFTSSVYHRTWELVTPLEPPHGTPRLAGANAVSHLALLNSGSQPALAVLLPSGRLWTDWVARDRGRLTLTFEKDDTNGNRVETGFRVGGKWTSVGGNGIAAVSNWVSAAVNYRETAAIRSDGSLWVSEKPRQLWDPYANRGRLPPEEQSAPLVRFGSETDWQNVKPYGSASMILLKGNGTLWHWTLRDLNATNNVPRNKRGLPGLREFEPQQLGDEPDWTKLFSTQGRIYAWKKNGDAWFLHDHGNQPRIGEIPLDTQIVAERLPGLDNRKFRSLTWCWPLEAAVAEDGTLWTWSFKSREGWSPEYGVPVGSPIRIGMDTNWVSVAGNPARLVALKSDGTLYQWNLGDQETTFELAAMSPVRVGGHSDWVTLSADWRGIITLAADGGLWYWRNRDDPWDAEQPMLENSRRPEFIENIFSARESGTGAGTVKN